MGGQRRGTHGHGTVQTNPIPACCNTHHSAILLLHRSRQGRVGRGLRDEGRGILYKRTQFLQVYHVKQSQFRASARKWARATGAGRPRRETIVPNKPNWPVPVLPNKPNFRMRQNEVNCCCDKRLQESGATCRPCKTKPISDGV